MVQRIMIVGQPGSGKSTLARELELRTGLPVVHIDRIHWQAGWIERTREEKTRLCDEVEAREAWIFEGGHSATWPNRLARAEMLIWLDLPIWLRLWRVLRRSAVYHGVSRPDLPEGCPERIGPETLPFLRWIWNTRHSARAAMGRLQTRAPAQMPVCHLRSRAEVRRFLRDWPSALGQQGRAGRQG